MKHPEIMCTLTSGQIMGPERFVRDMYAAGMRSVRINTAHLGGVAELDRIARRLKSLIPDLRILIDTKGPEMRTTTIDASGPIRICRGEDVPPPSTKSSLDSINLAEGQQVTVMGDPDEGPTTADIIRVNYPDIHRHVAPGSILLIDDARIVLRVEDVDGSGRGRPSSQYNSGRHPKCNAISARVVQGGALGGKKGIAVQGIDVPLPAVSDHDRQYIDYASTSPYVDVIAHSFVRSADDVQAVRAAQTERKPVIAKIENQQGLDNLAEIIAVSDGVLIARGDLTASIGRQAIPAAQARIAHVTTGTGLPLYLATNILSSLMHADTPSGADIAGILTAISQGVDVLLLTNETASGPRPVHSVEVLHSIIRTH